MDTFHYIVLTIAIVALVIMFVFVAIMMTYNNASTVFPPYTSTCPNYWKLNNDGNCVVPGNSTTAGINTGVGFTSITSPTSGIYGYNSRTGAVDFNDPAWAATTAKSATCAKSMWAQTNSILWDGVSNFNGNCR